MTRFSQSVREDFFVIETRIALPTIKIQMILNIPVFVFLNLFCGQAIIPSNDGRLKTPTFRSDQSNIPRKQSSFQEPRCPECLPPPTVDLNTINSDILGSPGQLFLNTVLK